MKDDVKKKTRKALEEVTDTAEMALAADYSFKKFSGRFEKVMRKCGATEGSEDEALTALYKSYSSHMEEAREALDGYMKTLSALFEDMKALVSIRDKKNKKNNGGDDKK